MRAATSKLESQLPKPGASHLIEVMPGIVAGRPEWALSPAYWQKLSAIHDGCGKHFTRPESLLSEIGFCLLGGHGITAEVNCAAYHHLREHGVFDENNGCTSDRIAELLHQPLDVGGRLVRYRFPNQKAKRVFAARSQLRVHAAPEEPRKLRAYLLDLPGVGPKTASWITRNWLDTDDVAIIDIHVERACRVIGLFDQNLQLPQNYFEMEELFLAFAQAIGVRASILDVTIWSEMRKMKFSSEFMDFQEGFHGERRRRRRPTKRTGEREKASQIEAAA